MLYTKIYEPWTELLRALSLVEILKHFKKNTGGWDFEKTIVFKCKNFANTTQLNVFKYAP